MAAWFDPVVGTLTGIALSYLVIIPVMRRKRWPR